VKNSVTKSPPEDKLFLRRQILMAKITLQLSAAEIIALEILANEGAEAILTEPTQTRAWLIPSPGVAAANRALDKLRHVAQRIRHCET
jgi:hypothetical protein